MKRISEMKEAAAHRKTTRVAMIREILLLTAHKAFEPKAEARLGGYRSRNSSVMDGNRQTPNAHPITRIFMDLLKMLEGCRHQRKKSIHSPPVPSFSFADLREANVVWMHQTGYSS
jgi:hypothetical protein